MGESLRSIKKFSHAIDEKNIRFEQYKILSENVLKSKEMREQSDIFWTSINVALVAALSYLNHEENVGFFHKNIFIWAVVCLGFSLCFSWVIYIEI